MPPPGPCPSATVPASSIPAIDNPNCTVPDTFIAFSFGPLPLSIAAFSRSACTGLPPLAYLLFPLLADFALFHDGLHKAAILCTVAHSRRINPQTHVVSRAEFTRLLPAQSVQALSA